ncbi:MAG: hypothetical protein ACE5D7_11805, partial [Fidelibacterota bacterium]
MLAIAQIPGSFYYLNWIPSDRGPLVTQFGEIPFNNYSFDDSGYLGQLIQSIFQNKTPELPVFTLSLDSNEVLFSQIRTHEEFSCEDLINWQLNHCGGESFQNLFRTLSYRL